MTPTTRRRFEQLWLKRFSSLPLDCGFDTEPGIDEVEEWREWHDKDSTPDQQRIEDYLEYTGVNGLNILHIGAGNSRLAARFAGRAAYILGTTISVNEKALGAAMQLANYDIIVHNKYSTKPLSGKTDRFDVIIDNNPSSFCCCWRHMGTMMDHYSSWVAPNGKIVSDKLGLGWVVSTLGTNQRWRFSFADWKAVGGAFGLEAGRFDDFIYHLAPRSERRSIWCTGRSFRGLFDMAKGLFQQNS